jgi:tRNA dimethylallyltransferase
MEWNYGMGRRDRQDETDGMKDAPSQAALPVIVVAGPTASGKSGLALALASEGHGTIINADSMQVYHDLPILTAQPSAEAQAILPHRLYGLLALDDPCTAARWAQMAFEEIQAAHEGKRVPFLVGGTGLYLKALLEGFAPIPDIDPSVRERTRGLLAEIGPAALHGRLRDRDPETAARLRPSDPQRIARAWEVLEATGKPLAWWQAQPKVTPGPVVALSLVTDPPRADLYAACDARFLAMLAEGALAEVAAARRRYPAADPELAGFRALGFRELAGHLDGRLSVAEATAAAQQATRNYAKRQGTWFRHQLRNAILLFPGGAAMKFSQSSLAEMRHKIRDFLLTHSS